MEFYTYIGRVKKTGSLRFLSNMEYMRALERTLKRASFPLWMTQGFHPRAKLSFPIALATGTVDLTGFFEFRLTEDIPKNQTETLINRFNLKAPKGLSMANIWKIDKGGLLSKLIKYYEFKIIVEKSKMPDQYSNIHNDSIVNSNFVKLKDFVVVEYIMSKDKITKPENILNNLVSVTENEIFYIPICYRALDEKFEDIVKVINSYCH